MVQKGGHGLCRQRKQGWLPERGCVCLGLEGRAESGNVERRRIKQGVSCALSKGPRGIKSVQKTNQKG